jgi:hypothetical protein
VWLNVRHGFQASRVRIRQANMLSSAEVGVGGTVDHASRLVAIERWHCSTPSLKQSRLSVRVLAAGAPGHAVNRRCTWWSCAASCDLPPKSSAASGPSSWGLPERRLLVVGAACHRATRRGCRHRWPPRQHQPEKVTAARLATPYGAAANPCCRAEAPEAIAAGTSGGSAHRPSCIPPAVPLHTVR